MRNIIYVNYILLMILNYGYVLGWLAGKKEKLFGDEVAGFYSNVSCKYGIAIILSALVLLCVGTADEYGTSLEAVKELATGQAQQYYSEAMERKELYLDESVSIVEADPYSVTPRLLFFDDITDDATNWKNVTTSGYYGKESVVLNEYVSYIEYD